MRLHINPNPSFREATHIGRSIKKEEYYPMEEMGFSPADSCLKGIRQSKYVFTINAEDGEPIALVGVVEHKEYEDTGVIWSMSTNRVSEFPVAFIKALRGLIVEYGGLYSRLISMALSDNPKHQRFHLTLGMLPTGEEVPIKHTPLCYKVFELMTTKGLNKLYYEQS